MILTNAIIEKIGHEDFFESSCTPEQQKLFLGFLKRLKIKKKEFARNIDITPVTLSTWLRNKKLKRKYCAAQFLHEFNKYLPLLGPIKLEELNDN